MGFLSFLDPKPRLLQLYGKLPLAKDYLRIGMGSGLGLEFRSWMDDCFSSSLKPGAERLLKSDAGFVLSAGAGKGLFGCLWNSSDAGGLRSFPLGLGVEQPVAPLWSREEGAGLALTALLSDLERLRRRAADFENGQQLLAAMRGLEVLKEPVRKRQPGGGDFEGWTQRLWPAKGLDGLAQAVEDMRSAGADSAQQVLRIPIVDALDGGEQWELWMQLMLRCGWANRRVQPNLFLQRAGTSDRGWRWLFATRRPLCLQDARLLCEEPTEACPPGELRLGQASAKGLGTARGSKLGGESLWDALVRALPLD